MSERNPAPPVRAGFTLIEVIGALLIFSLGVIMVLQITTSLSRRMEYAAVNSVIAAEGQRRLDSLGVLSYASVATGATQQTITIRGVSYLRIDTVALTSPLVKKVTFYLKPVAGDWPTFDATLYLSDSW